MRVQVKKVVRKGEVITLEYEVLYTGLSYTVNLDPSLYNLLDLDNVYGKATYIIYTDLLDIQFRKARFKEGISTIITELDIVYSESAQGFLGWMNN